MSGILMVCENTACPWPVCDQPSTVCEPQRASMPAKTSSSGNRRRNAKNTSRGLAAHGRCFCYYLPTPAPPCPAAISRRKAPRRLSGRD